MVVLLALWIEESSPLLTAVALSLLTSSSAIGVWLVAVGSVALEVIWASLPACVSMGSEAIIASIIAQVLTSVLALSTGGNWDS